MTKNVEFATFTQTVMIRTVLLNTEAHQTSSKAGSGINILYLLTGPIFKVTGSHVGLHSKSGILVTMQDSGVVRPYNRLLKRSDMRPI